MALATRQPFGEIASPRLQALSSAKNRQNAISPNVASPLKPSLQPSTGKRRATAVFEDEDSENVDPSIFNSPSKKSKTSDGFSKPTTKFSLVASPSKPSFSLTASPSVPLVRKALSSPNTSNSTPIGQSRGSPKHKRVGALSKRRASSSPFRRVDPPSFSQSSPALPFSIDAALSGTIPNYTPKQSVATPVTPAPISTLEESMPKSWFFEIHEDTPEQEAANLMEHSAAVLDISSDDDVETKRRNEELERGKENIPPPDFLAAQPRMQQSADAMETVQEAAAVPVKRPRLRNLPQDAMDEDRRPLSDLAPADFYGEGLDATSYVTVDATIEKPSGLSKEFDFSCPTPEKKATKEAVPEAVPLPEETGSLQSQESIPIFSDESAAATETVVAPQEEVAPAAECVPLPQESASNEP